MIVPNLHLEKTHTWKNPGKNPKNPKNPGFFGFFQDFGFLPNPATQFPATIRHYMVQNCTSSISYPGWNINDLFQVKKIQ